MFTGVYDNDENAKHVGLTVYNMASSVGTWIPSGLYVWDGAKWNGINVKPALVTCDPLYYEPDATKYVDIPIAKAYNGNNTLRFLTYNLGANPNLTPKQQMGYTSGGIDDITVFGGLYQWGRKDAEHSLRCSVTDAPDSFTPDLYDTADDAIADGKFVTAATDWILTPINDLWGTGATISSGGNSTNPAKRPNDPCPSGFRIPTEHEFALIGQEGGSQSSTNGDWVTGIGTSGATFNSDIRWVPVSEGKASTGWGPSGGDGKTCGFALYTLTEWAKYTSGEDLTLPGAPEPLMFLPAGGGRRVGGVVENAGYHGYYWNSLVDNQAASDHMNFSGTIWDAGDGDFTNRSNGMSVRCIAEVN
jgi:hypothetical protein